MAVAVARALNSLILASVLTFASDQLTAAMYADAISCATYTSSRNMFDGHIYGSRSKRGADVTADAAM